MTESDQRNMGEFPPGQNEYIPENNYFMMGDNRFNSLDMRHSLVFRLAEVDPADTWSFLYRSRITSYNVCYTKLLRMIEKAYGGYKEINLRAMRLLENGGYLVTASCSHFFGADRFYSMLQHAAKDSRRTLQILEKRGPGPDHPALSGYPESDYLKCAIVRVW